MIFAGLKMRGNLKKTMVIVIVAALALSAFSTLLDPSVKAQTTEANVLSYTWYIAPVNTALAEWAGDLVAVGEIQNVGSTSIGTAFIVGNAYNSTGGFLASNEAQVYIYDLQPGQTAPFYLDFTPENSVTQDQSWVPYATNVTVEVTYVTAFNGTQFSLTSTGVSASNVDDTYTVTGTVQNTGSQTAGEVWVDTTFYNSSGSVIGLNFTNYLTDSFAPGQSLPFSASPTDNSAQLSSEIANYSVLVQAEPLSNSPSTTPFPISSSQPTSTPTQTSSISGKSSSSPSLIYIVIIIVVIAIVAATTLVFMRKRHNLPTPPPPPPPPEASGIV